MGLLISQRNNIAKWLFISLTLTTLVLGSITSLLSLQAQAKVETSPIGDFDQVATGDDHTCALADGQAYCWGSGEYGQLGSGTTTTSLTPVAVDTSGVLAGKTISQITAGNSHTCALADGQAYCWGYGGQGRLGNGTITDSPTPVAVDTSGVLAGNITEITAGYRHTCALADGQAYCWGYGASGRLGNGTSENSPIPVTVDTPGALAGKTISQITAGNYHTCALADGQAYCWGNGGYGRLGNGTTADSLTPVAVDTSGVLAGKTITEITVGSSYTCALADSQAYCWGGGYYGQLGNGTTADSLTPVAVDTSGVLAGKTISQITAGGIHTCALADGQAYCWGSGYQGRLGNGTTTNSPIPVTVDTSGTLAGKTITEITAGYYHTCALADSQAYCWGYGGNGELGNGTAAISPTPVAVIQQLIVVTPEVTDVSSAPVDGKTIMTITGEDLVGSVFDLSAAVTNPDSHFLVVNGTALPWCTDGTGYTTDDLPGYPASDNPACYYLLNSSGEFLVTPTEAKVWLPNDFDTEAPGTVSINGSAAFAFNQPASGGDDGDNENGDGEGNPTDNTKPTVTVDGKTLTATDTPQIAKRPTFTGTATPGASVTVTVYSDPVSCTTTADMDGNWSCTLPTNLPPGAHTVYVTITNPDNTVEELGPYSVTVPGDTTLTNLLAPNTGFQTLKQIASDSPYKLAAAVIGLLGLVVSLLAAAVVVRKLIISKRRS